MKKCYLCEKNIENNVVKPEHIIPNAVGGKLKSKCILCDKCNNKLSDIDQSLAKSAYFFTNLLNPKRDNKTKSNLPLKFNYNNRQFIREADGKYYSTKFTIEKIDNKLKIHLDAIYSAGNGAKDKALNPLLKEIDKLAKNYKWNEDKKEKLKENILKKISAATLDTNDTPAIYSQIELNKDGKLFLSMLKISIGFYLSLGYELFFIKDIIQILKKKDSKTSRKYCFYYYPDNFYKEDSIYHTIYLYGSIQSKVLYCLISIYGCINCIVLLNNNYNGETFEKSYCYDLRNNKEVQFNNSLILTETKIDNIINNTQKDLPEKMLNKYNSFMSFFVQKNFDKESNYISSIIDTCYKRCIIYDFMTEQNYIQHFKNELLSLMKQHKTLKYLYENQMLEIAEIALSLYNYDYYLNNSCMLKVISKIISEIILESLSENKTIEDCINKSRTYFSSYKTNIKEIDNIIINNKDIYEKKLINFIKIYYPKVQRLYFNL